MSRKYTDSTLSANANPEPNTASRIDVSTTTGSHGRNGLPAIRSDARRAPSRWRTARRHAARWRRPGPRGERHPADQTRIAGDRPESEVVDEGEKVPRQQAAKQVVRESVEAARIADRGLPVEEDAEDVAVDGHHRQRVQHRPGPAEERAPVLRAQLAEGQVPEELARPVDIDDGVHERLRGYQSAASNLLVRRFAMSSENASRMGQPAVSVRSVWKSYRLYHERNQYLKAAVLKRRRARFEEFWALKGVDFEVPSGSRSASSGRTGQGRARCSSASPASSCRSEETWPSKVALGTAGARRRLPPGAQRAQRVPQWSDPWALQKETTARFDDIVAFAGLEEFIDTPVKNYSWGCMCVGLRGCRQR